jgi:Na+-transporting NADH:ubiquinone oxidoreductase subunit NqrC
MMTQNQTSSANKKISNYIMAIVVVVLVLSVISLILAASSYLTGISTTSNPVTSSQTAQDDLTAGFLAVVGVIALTMSIFTLYQSRRQAAEMKIEVPKVMTIIQCTNTSCDFKASREFQRGDYVYKELDAPCTKCSGKQMITAIYKDVKEKEKSYNV